MTAVAANGRTAVMRNADGRECTKCREFLPWSSFYASKSSADGHQSWCISCSKTRISHRTVARSKDPAAQQDRIRRANLKQNFGITVEQYDEILEAQGGVCAGCKKPPGRKRLAVDHCRTELRIRGLLCDGCNKAVGLAGDNESTLRALAAYVATPTWYTGTQAVRNRY